MALTRKDADWWCERGMLLLLLAMLVFAPLAFGAVDAWAFLVLQGLAAVLFLLWGVRVWLNRKPKLLWPPLAWVAAAFMVYAVARYFTADIEYVARGELMQVLLFGFVFLLLLSNLQSQGHVQVISFTLIALATLISGDAVAQLVHHSNQGWTGASQYAGRAAGTFSTPNNLAGMLSMVLPLTLAYLVVGRVGVITRILLAYGAVAIMAGLAVTFSRAGWVAAGVGIVMVLGVLIGHRNHRLRALLLLLALLLGGGFFTSHYLSKTVGYMRRVAKPDAGGPGVIDLNSRLSIWRSAGQMWQDHFWWGVGPAHFDYRFREYRPEGIQLRPERVHNDYLNLLADWGAVGGMIVLAGMGLLVVGLVRTWPHVRREENDFGNSYSNRFAFFLGATGGLTALAVHSLMDFDLHVPADALLGVTLLGLLAGNLRFATERYWHHAGVPVKCLLSGGLATLILVFILQMQRQAGELFWLARAARQENFSVEQTRLLRQAFAAEPQDFQVAYDIGECFRRQGQDAVTDVGDPTLQAMDWFARAIRLNPYDGYSFMRTGMCLDWLDRPAEAAECFHRAERCDPNGYFMVAYIGWHYVQMGNYAAARQWFERSLKLQDHDNNLARNYLQICENRLQEAASGSAQPPAIFRRNVN